MPFSPCQAITKALHSAKKTKALLLLLLLFKRKKKTICIYSVCSSCGHSSFVSLALCIDFHKL